jgi:hypothetical protein
MHRVFITALAAFILFPVSSGTAHAAAGDACASTGAVQREGAQTLICNGTQWVLLSTSNTDSSTTMNGTLKIAPGSSLDLDDYWLSANISNYTPAISSGTGSCGRDTYASYCRCASGYQAISGGGSVGGGMLGASYPDNTTGWIVACVSQFNSAMSCFTIHVHCARIK